MTFCTDQPRHNESNNPMRVIIKEAFFSCRVTSLKSAQSRLKLVVIESLATLTDTVQWPVL